MSLCDGRLVLIKLSAGVEQLLSSLVWWAPSASVLHTVLQDRQEEKKEVFTTAVDSPVYWTQHPSLDANLHAWTKTILGDTIKIQCACVFVITVSPCVHCDRAPPISGVQSCVYWCRCRAGPTTWRRKMDTKSKWTKLISNNCCTFWTNPTLLSGCLSVCVADAVGSAVCGIMIREVFITVAPCLFPPPQSS